MGRFFRCRHNSVISYLRMSSKEEFFASIILPPAYRPQYVQTLLVPVKVYRQQEIFNSDQKSMEDQVN